MDVSLSGKVAVVTGASSGIGAALAPRLAGAGARVAICARGAGGLARTRDAIAAAGGDGYAEQVDIRDPEAVRLFAAHVLARYGRVDALVNNAGLLGPRAPLAQFPPEEWGPVIETNVNGTFYVTRAFLPSMLRATAGSIITVTSGVGNRARPNWGAYGVSKFAQEGFALALAAELEGTGVRSNLVDPGPTRTRMRAAAYPGEDPAALQAPGEIAAVFLYLSSDASRQVNGRRFQASRFAVTEGASGAPEVGGETAGAGEAAGAGEEA